MQQDYNVSVESKPFLLRPGTPVEGKPRPLREGETTDQLAEPLNTYAKEAGLVMRRPPKIAYTMYALQASEYAKEQGLFESFHKGLYKAYWEFGKDIGDLDVIKEVAIAEHLDWTELGPMLESNQYEESVMQQYTEAMDMGINGIPGFLIGRYLLTGARPYEFFQSIMTKAIAEQNAVS